MRFMGGLISLESGRALGGHLAAAKCRTYDFNRDALAESRRLAGAGGLAVFAEHWREVGILVAPLVELKIWADFFGVGIAGMSAAVCAKTSTVVTAGVKLAVLRILEAAFWLEHFLAGKSFLCFYSTYIALCLSIQK
ncbi:MAG TPA: hypothetical protein VKX49_00140 [Bryobacteraceae bacterium]|nr:hypothetical protein [Bryobacteraceae bacterium]